MSATYEQIKDVLNSLASKGGALGEQKHVGVLKDAESEEIKKYVAKYVAEKFNDDQIDQQKVYDLFAQVMVVLFSSPPFNGGISDDVRKFVCQGFGKGVVELASNGKITTVGATSLLDEFGRASAGFGISAPIFDDCRNDLLKCKGLEYKAYVFYSKAKAFCDSPANKQDKNIKLRDVLRRAPDEYRDVVHKLSKNPEISIPDKRDELIAEITKLLEGRGDDRNKINHYFRSELAEVVRGVNVAITEVQKLAQQSAISHLRGEDGWTLAGAPFSG